MHGKLKPIWKKGVLVRVTKGCKRGDIVKIVDGPNLDFCVASVLVLPSIPVVVRWMGVCLMHMLGAPAAPRNIKAPRRRSRTSAPGAPPRAPRMLSRGVPAGFKHQDRPECTRSAPSAS